jgi:NADP-dependent aldehyde dehydrogenase
MALHGRHLIGGERASAGGSSFTAADPARGIALQPAFADASAEEVDRAAALAAAAADDYRALGGRHHAGLLRAVAERLEALGDELLDRARAETALPADRLVSERARTTAQLRMFAAMLDDGSWVDARIERGDRSRKPLPKPDLRRMSFPIGPVAVFGASNFPLAFSVAGGDTASALAAGCPIVVKAHPAHPGTSELAAEAVAAAVADAGAPAGTFSMVQGRAHRVGAELVRHPAIRAVCFTGSLRGGRALFDLAATRPEPIPVFAEMGSVNPVFVLPSAAARGAELARRLAASITVGCGQFCTSPGMIVVPRSAESESFATSLAAEISATAPGTMVDASIAAAYGAELRHLDGLPGITRAAAAGATGGPASTAAATPTLYRADARVILATPRLREEIYGPVSILVDCRDPSELLAVAKAMHGHLTATILGTAEELAQHAELVRVLESRVGRLIWNGFPTGLEVGPATHHGGPYPATTDPRFTSVGTAAVQRFARPLCFQDFPDEALPPALRDGNPLGIWRLVDGELRRGPV